MVPLKTVEINKLIDNFLGHYCKSLSPTQKNTICNAQSCTNPLFLRTVLEELRVFGVFEELSLRILSFTFEFLESIFNFILDIERLNKADTIGEYVQIYKIYSIIALLMSFSDFTDIS